MSTTEQKRKNRLFEALGALGGSVESIRQTLRAKGIKGKVGCPNGCVIARYLNMRYRNKYSRVGLFTANVGWTSVELPEVIRRFIGSFDAEAYPELIEESND
jgi:hypothetical protein